VGDLGRRDLETWGLGDWESDTPEIETEKRRNEEKEKQSASGLPLWLPIMTTSQ
jgi:hypothetical protein